MAGRVSGLDGLVGLSLVSMLVSFLYPRYCKRGQTNILTSMCARGNVLEYKDRHRAPWARIATLFCFSCISNALVQRSLCGALKSLNGEPVVPGWTKGAHDSSYIVNIFPEHVQSVGSNSTRPISRPASSTSCRWPVSMMEWQPSST